MEAFHNLIDKNMDHFHRWWVPRKYEMGTAVSEELEQQVLEKAKTISVKDAQIPGYYGLTIFHQLVAHNYFDAVKILLEKGVDVDIRGEAGKGDYEDSHKGITPFHLACHAGNLKMVQLLLAYGADENLCDDKGRNGFHFLGSTWYKRVLNYADFDEMDINTQRIAIAKLLKCDINQKDVDGVTPLIRLTQNKKRPMTISLVDLYIELGANATATDNLGNTALIHAVENRQLTATQALVKYPEIINVQNSAGDTALIKCFFSREWNYAAAYLIMENGGDVSFRNNKGESVEDFIEENKSESYYRTIIKCLTKKALTLEDYQEALEKFARDWWGGEYDDYSTFVHYIARIILRKIDRDDDTELIYAKELMEDFIRKKDEACYALQMFYDEGYDLCMSICKGSQVTTFRDMCCEEVMDNENILPKLKELGVDINEALVDGCTMANIVSDRRVNQRMKISRLGWIDDDDESDYDKFAKIFDWFSVESIEQLNNDGKAAVHYVAENNSYFVINKMVQRGVNLNLTTDAPSNTCDTPLHLACKRQCVETVEALIEAGVDDSIKNINEETPAYSVFTDYDRFEAEKSYKIIELLNCIDTPLGDDGVTPFMKMLEKDPYNVKEFTELFMEKGVDINSADGRGNTPLLIHARRRCDRDVMKMLINAGADINARNDDGNTVLHYVLDKGNCELARLLIKKGADYKVYNKKGVTPVSIAVEKGYSVVLEVMTDI